VNAKSSKHRFLLVGTYTYIDKLIYLHKQLVAKKRAMFCLHWTSDDTTPAKSDIAAVLVKPPSFDFIIILREYINNKNRELVLKKIP
jgi:hypothetical protein